MIKKLKCKVCGARWRARKEDRKTVTLDESKSTLVGGFTQQLRVGEAFDCPECGCQNIVSIRQLECDITDEAQEPEASDDA